MKCIPKRYPLFLILGLAIFANCKKTSTVHGIQVVIDSEIPNSKVYHKNNYLGIAPVTLNESQLDEMGVPHPLTESSSWNNWIGDISGIATSVSESNRHIPTFSFDAPQGLHTETPWGARVLVSRIDVTPSSHFCVHPLQNKTPFILRCFPERKEVDRNSTVRFFITCDGSAFYLQPKFTLNAFHLESGRKQHISFSPSDWSFSDDPSLTHRSLQMEFPDLQFPGNYLFYGVLEFRLKKERVTVYSEGRRVVVH